MHSVFSSHKCVSLSLLLQQNSQIFVQFRQQLTKELVLKCNKEIVKKIGCFAYLVTRFKTKQFKLTCLEISMK